MIDSEARVCERARRAVAEGLMLTLILDIRDLPVDRRLTCVLARFDALAPQDVLRLVTDRDPQRMRASLVGDDRWRATWSPERQGPETWVIRIDKLAPGDGRTLTPSPSPRGRGEPD